jgi:predicted nucleotidyltransferase
MRLFNALDALIPPLRQLVLAELIARGQRPIYRRELANRLGVPASSLQRPLAAMVQTGILRASKRGRELYYEAYPENPLLPELRSLMRKSRGLVGVIREVLGAHEAAIRVALVYGSFATGAETPASDVDLLVVGSVTLLQITPALNRAEKILGRPVNAIVMTPSDVRERASAGNHFLRSILDKPKLFVVGTEDELGEIVGRKPRGAKPRRRPG